MGEDKAHDYLAYLPAVFQRGVFGGRFLKCFERILSRTIPDTPGGRGSHHVEGVPGMPDALEEIIAGLHTYFDPEHTPPEFLPWLARWVGLSLWEDWSIDERRRFIREIVPLYRWRGTKFGLKELLRIYAAVEQDAVQIHEFDEPLHYFEVKIEGQGLDEKRAILIRIIDQEKPAHTYYTLITPT